MAADASMPERQTLQDGVVAQHTAEVVRALLLGGGQDRSVQSQRREALVGGQTGRQSHQRGQVQVAVGQLECFE